MGQSTEDSPLEANRSKSRDFGYAFRVRSPAGYSAGGCFFPLVAGAACLVTSRMLSK